ncbi:MAG: carbamoyltransferase HypF, partial [Pseudomonadales bacterium]|nr:carbamoyltransferase HypF [Pseudomonadales bacterium]
MNGTDRVHACVITISGRVQGVGYRPFVYRLAHTLGVVGRVFNVSGEVKIEAEASSPALHRFKKELIDLAPPLSRPSIKCIESTLPGHFTDFSITISTASEHQDIHLPPDQFACSDCIDEMQDRNGHRYRYPFINCTQCGPRYTIINRLPYDRPNTTMSNFPLCPVCRTEYENPLDRRFHAQPLACPTCWPMLTYHGSTNVEGTEASLAACLRYLREGNIVAARGVGGCHL